MEELSDTQKIEVIQRQTTYTSDECCEHLKKYDGDYISVIKQFMGIKPKQTTVKSVNQEIYKQIRHKLDGSMKDYNNKNPINLNDVANQLG